MARLAQKVLIDDLATATVYRARELKKLPRDVVGDIIKDCGFSRDLVDDVLTECNRRSKAVEDATERSQKNNVRRLIDHPDVPAESREALNRLRSSGSRVSDFAEKVVTRISRRNNRNARRVFWWNKD